MRKARITITLSQHIVDSVDRLINNKTIRNRSHAIEYIIDQYFPSIVKKAVILAGGQGTHLRPYTYEIPKALLPIKSKPLLEYLIKNLKKNGINEIIICIGYLGEKIKKYFGNGEKFGVKISYSEEKQTLQTGGAILQIKDRLKNQAFLVIYGDTLSNIPLRDLVNFHEQQQTLATITLIATGNPTLYGQLKLHGTKLVDFFQNKKISSVKSYLVNCGIYVFNSKIFDYFPKDKKSFLLEDVIENLIKDKKISGFVFEGQWFDVGDPKNYEKAIKEFEI